MTSTLLFALALVAGGVAAFNPCGVALFPGYLTMLIQDGGPGRHSAWFGLVAGFSLSLGFIVVFGLFGLILRQLDGTLLKAAPIVSLTVAACLLGIGVASWLGVARLRLPAWLIGGVPRTGHLSWRLLVYGAVYALVSVSCSLPVFLAISVQALAQGGSWPVVVMLLYAVGMGVVMTLVAILTVSARHLVELALSRALPQMGRISGAIFILSGAYLAWYWLVGPEQLLR